jgi:hypothetical protein
MVDELGGYYIYTIFHFFELKCGYIIYRVHQEFQMNVVFKVCT